MEEAITLEELDRMKSEVKRVLDGVKRCDGRLSATEFRWITQKGVPLLNIMLKSIPIECLEKGINDWFDKFLKE